MAATAFLLVWTVVLGRCFAGSLINLGPGRIPTALSGDGQVVMGMILNGINSPNGHLFRWHASQGFQTVAPPSAPQLDIAFDQRPFLSDDGSVAAWSVDSRISGYMAYRWTQSAGPEDLKWSRSPLYQGYLSVSALSADGSTLVGGAQMRGSISVSATHAFRWTRDAGFTAIRTLTHALAVSTNGSVIVGPASDPSLGWGLFDRTEGFRSLGLPPGWTTNLDLLHGATSVLLPDASQFLCAAGMITTETLTNAVLNRWHRSTGAWETIPTPFVPESLKVQAASADGSLILGYGRRPQSAPFTLESWVRTPDGVFNELRGYLTAHGVDPSGWLQLSALALSFDGKVLLGTGFAHRPDGYMEMRTWVAQTDETQPPFIAQPLAIRRGKALEFQPVNGRTYRLQFSLDGTNWQPEGEPFVGGDTVHQRFFTPTEDPHPFHRYVEIP